MLEAAELKLSSRIALTPRQVLLNMKKPIEFQNGSQIKTLTLESEQSQNPLLHHSICQYLQRHGFSKSLKSFRSEAQLQNEEWKSCSLDLEEMCNKYLSKGGKDDSTFNSHKEKDLQKDAVTKEDGDGKDVAPVETVSKKKIKKHDSSDTNVIVDQSGSAEKSEILTDDLVSDPKVKSKENKKSKLVSDTRGENCEKIDLESINGTEKHMNKKKKKSKVISEEAEAKSQGVESLQGIGKVDSETEAKSKDEKKKKNKKAASESFGDQVEELENEEPKELADAVQKEKKGSKKRKRLASEENDSQILVNASSEVENVQVGFNETQKSPLKHLDVHTNGDLEKSGEQNNTLQKSRKKQCNVSAEPKTVNAFQRVKVDEVVFADNRLQNNSYWAKDGADIGYGAKAQEVLGQVKGRDFRHEKTKKKRGSYKGGQIDLHSHSVKFNYSDDD